MTESLIRRLLSQIDPSRLAQLTLDLVRIPSPTGAATPVIQWYAEYLRSRNLPAEIHTVDGEQVVIARFSHQNSGPSLTLLGHLDHTQLEHPPAYQENASIFGRGAAEPKSGVAALTEALQVVSSVSYRLKGTLSLIVHVTHGNPQRWRNIALEAYRSGHFGNAIVCASGPHTLLPIMGRGCAIFECHLRRQGEVKHELHVPRGEINPLVESCIVLERLIRWNEELSRVSWPYIGPESIHIGTIEAGDNPDRFPNYCRIAGTRRFGPGKTAHEILAEFQQIQREMRFRTVSDIDLRATVVGLGYRIHEQEPIVQATCNAYKLVAGKSLPVGGYLDVGEGSVTSGELGIPTVHHGTNRDRIDADLEFVNLRDIVRAARVYLATIGLFIGWDIDAAASVDESRRS